MTIPTGHTSSVRPDKILVITLAFLMGATAFSVDSSLAAIPAVAQALAISTGTAQLTVSIYLLGFGLGQIPMGFMADYFGRRRLLLISMSLFTLAGLLTSVSPSADMLLMTRFIQGFCGASAAVIARAVARDITEGKETVQLMGLLTSTTGVTMIIGPLIGGVALTWFGWRASFGISALFGTIGLLLAIVFLPETNRSERQTSALQTFVFSAKSFIQTPAALIGAILVALSFAGLMTYITTSSDLLIRHYQISPLLYAVSFSIAAAGYMTGGLVSRYLARKQSHTSLIRRTAMVYLCCAGVIIAFLAGIPHPLWAIIGLVFVYFACISAMLSQATAYTLEPLPKSAGMAAAILGSFQLLAGAGTSLILAGLNLSSLNSLLGMLLVFALLIVCWVFVFIPLVQQYFMRRRQSG
ncbi:MAG: MFS transporter [Thiolinea sp.]